MAASAGDWLERLKYSPPPLGRGIIQRTPLQTLVGKGIAENAVTLVHAPAGFGKTTLLAQLSVDLVEAGSRVAWLTCGEEDRQPETFASNLAASLSAAGIGSGGSDQSIGSIVRTLEQAGTPEKPAVLIIDEAETIDEGPVVPLLERLGLIIAGSARLLVGARHRPAFVSVQLRLAGRLTVIGPVEMRFLEEDAIKLIGDTLPAGQRDALLTRAEGWPMVLQLACQLLNRDSDVQEEIVTLLSAPDSDIFTYMAEQIFDRLPEQVRGLLKTIAIFDKVDPHTVASVTAMPDAYALLQGLRYLQPIMVFDNSATGGARIHPLFREFLLERLRREGKGREQELRLQAAALLAQQGNALAAVQQAVAAGSPETACRIIEDGGGLLLNVGEGAGRVRTMLQDIPDQVLARHPRLVLTHIVEMLLNDQAIVAMPSLAALREKLDTADPVTAEDIAWADATIALLEHPAADSPELSECTAGQLARARRLAATEPRALAMALPLSLITAQRMAPVAEAEKLQAETLAWYADAGLHRQRPWGLLHQAMIDTAAGNYDAAMDILTMILPDSLQGLSEVQAMLTQTVNALVAWIAYETGDTALSQQRINRLPSPRAGTMYEILYARMIVAARCAAAEGGKEKALSMLEACGHPAQELGFPNIAQHAAAARVILLSTLGRAGEAQELATTALPQAEHVMTAADAVRPWQVRLDTGLAWIGVQLEQGAIRDAGTLAQRILETSLHQGRQVSTTAAHLANARVYHTLQRQAEALQHTRDALLITGHTGASQVFMDQGPVIPLLLRELSSGTVGSDAGPLAAAQRLLDVWERAFQRQEGAAVLFTQRELDILAEMSLGRATKVAARTLDISPETVKHHLKSIFRKLEVHDRHEAVREARRRALIP
ncbi:LuxR C-terminal-related transcriptional regulator [Kineobactrum salinum]|uniref:AAA family ATPase n=1 Tax=Kineobactrum salinum TaxID=2708301 RepID=A0A6C0U4U2_9GAMM|nr:LuxR C-terminal-related transcriptional regulator [Kineobactrum salinum]QIB67016.1 AAA family ATPase [Kineobactrum salinum]